MARRAEEVETGPRAEWVPSPELQTQLQEARARLDRGEGIPWREVRASLRATLASGDVHMRARAAAGIPEGQDWTPPREVLEEMGRAREAAYAADAAGEV